MYRVTILDGKNLPLILICGVRAADWPLLWLLTDQEGWRNIPNLSQQEVHTVQSGHPAQ